MAMRVRDLGEFGFIERISRLIPSSSHVVVGVGDDCAVLRVRNRLMLASTDLFIEGVHFRRDFSTPEEIGWKAAVAALSDVAAMGGTPQFCLVSLACPPDTEVSFLENTYRGLANVLSRFGAFVVGGDTAHSSGQIMIDVVMLGEVAGKRYVPRTGTQVGDVLAVIGHLGLSAAGLHALEHGNEVAELVLAHRMPNPRIREGRWLAEHDGVNAMIDTSDGLCQDAGHLAAAASMGLNIFADKLPILPPLNWYCDKFSLDPKAFMLTGGEDYELAFSVKPTHADQLIEAFRAEFRTEIQIVGEFTDAWSGVRVDGQKLQVTGYDHFR